MPRGNNPDYWVTLINQTQGISIVADMPEHFSYATASQYDAASGMALGSIPTLKDPTGLTNIQISGNTAASAIGGDVLIKSLTKRIWKGTAAIEFTLALLFDAETNSKNDVHDKQTLLASLALPGTAGGIVGGAAGAVGTDVLLPPNPIRFGSTYNQLSIRIGRQYFWPSMIVMNAVPSFDQRLNRGFPIAGQIDLTVSTDYVYSKEDLFNAAGLTSLLGLPGQVPAAIADQAAGLSAVQLNAIRRGD